MTVSVLAAAALAACSRWRLLNTDVRERGPLAADAAGESLQSAGGTWATVPMGHLGQPLNTFWQLFFRPAGGTAWSNQVQATATATNGGLSSPRCTAAALIAGVRPSNLLTYSPLISTADGGRSWSTGLVSEGLAARPDALAANSPVRRWRSSTATAGAQVLASTERPLRVAHGDHHAALAATAAGRACALASITAVAYWTETRLSAPAARDRAWSASSSNAPGAGSLLGATPPRSLAGVASRCSRCRAAGSGVQALLASPPAAGTVSSLPGIPRPVGRLASADGERIRGGLSYRPGEREWNLRVARRILGDGSDWPWRAARATGWQQLTPPPAGTATVAFGPGSSVEALAVQDTVLSVWSIASSAPAWTPDRPSRSDRVQLLRIERCGRASEARAAGPARAFSPPERAVRPAPEDPFDRGSTSPASWVTSRRNASTSAGTPTGRRTPTGSRRRAAGRRTPAAPRRQRGCTPSTTSGR